MCRVSRRVSCNWSSTPSALELIEEVVLGYSGAAQAKGLQLFALIDSNGVLLLEEPEINLHPGIVAQFPEFIAKIQRVKKGGRQVFITTHSYDILSNEGIAPEEVLLLTNSPEGTEVEVLSDVEKAKNILAAGFSMADVVMPLTKPWSIESMSHIKLD